MGNGMKTKDMEKELKRDQMPARMKGKSFCYLGISKRINDQVKENCNYKMDHSFTENLKMTYLSKETEK